MQGETSIGEGLLWSLRFFGDIIFRWVPGTVQVITGTASPDPVASAAILKPITQPVTTADVAYFLQSAASQSVYDSLYHNWTIYVAISIVVSLLCATLIIYCAIRVLQIRRRERLKLEAIARPVVAKDISKTQLRWDHVLERAHSSDEKDWRLAILEADIMLNDLLDMLGYKGETMADKMKQAGRARFQTIDLAWDAHRVRNSIAHKGTMLTLTQHEVRRVIALYRHVFHEFGFVK